MRVGRKVHRQRNSYDNVIYAVDDFLINGIQVLQH